MDTDTPVTMWRIILIDWYKCSARVTLTLRSGKEFTGRIRRNPSETYDHVALEGDRVSNNEVRHDVDINEVVAITAVAR